MMESSLAKLSVLSTDLLAHYRQVSQQALTVVDVETTGHRAIEGRVIEVSALQGSLSHGILRQQTHLINPQVDIPESISRFTGITQTMVEPALAPEQVWPLYLPVLADGVLTAHNLGFDYSFIQSEFARLEINFSKPIGQQLCTVTLSRLMLPDLPSRRLPDLVQHFDFQVGRSHRAEADTLACWFLAKLLLSEIQNLPDRVLLDRFAQQWLPLGDAAMLLGCSGKKARVLLEKAGVKPRLVGRHKTAVYQRGEVEQAYWKNVEPTQLSWL